MSSKLGAKMSDALGQETAAHYDVTQQVGHLLRKAYQRHLAIFHEGLARYQLTSAQFVTLCTLRDQRDSSQVDLVRATAVDQATIRGVVERLKARGLIALKRDRDDGRKVVISLTAAGVKLLEAAIPEARQISEVTVQGLNQAERIALDYLLRKISV
jgi:DNA-binding MarR family transcriptional regulator